MERSIQTGDYAVVSHGEESQLYSIESVGPMEISIALVADATQKRVLVPQDSKWTVGGTTVRYKIEFRSKEDIPQLLFTEVPEVDTKILNELDDESLSLVCQLDRYANSLCQTDDLWRKRLERYFGDRKPPIKLLSEGWRDYYRRTSEVFNRIYVVSEINMEEAIEGISIFGLYKTKGEAADAIIDILEDIFADDGSGVLKFDLGPFRNYGPEGSGGRVTVDELKQLLTIDNIPAQSTGDILFSITFIDRNRIPV